MSHASKNNWAPTTSSENQKLRAMLYQKIRAFFYERHVLEVETPILSQHTVTDRYIESFQVKHTPPYFLQTSPEYAMKRLLASGSGPIFQICKAFRVEEAGSHHNPEFTMLEWYRPGFDHHDFMAEMDLFFQTVLNTKPATKISYQDLFLMHLSIDPLNSDLKSLHTAIKKHEINIDLSDIDYDTALQILLTHLIEPKLGMDAPLFLYDFPASQASLAKICDGVGERFEVYLNGIEIGNGFHELTDAIEQKQRFLKDQQKRADNGQYVPAIDERFLSALLHGLPDCTGVAIGVDRLLMYLAQSRHIHEVINFPWEIA